MEYFVRMLATPQQTDYYIGQVLATLEKNGLSQNTIVIFSSDNGSYWTEADIKASGHQSNNNLRGMKADISTVVTAFPCLFAGRATYLPM